MEADHYLEHGDILKVTKKGEYEVVSTRGLGPCIGIAIYDKNTKSGYIGYGISGSYQTIENTIAMALDDYGNPEGLHVVVAGANKPFKKDKLNISNEYILLNASNKNAHLDEDKLADKDWEKMKEIVQKYEFYKVEFKRAKIGQDQELILDCIKGKPYVEKESNFSYISPDESY